MGVKKVFFALGVKKVFFCLRSIPPSWPISMPCQKLSIATFSRKVQEGVVQGQHVDVLDQGYVRTLILYTYNNYVIEQEIRLS